VEVMVDIHLADLPTETPVALICSLLSRLVALRVVEELEESHLWLGIRELLALVEQEISRAALVEVEEDTTVVGVVEQTLAGQAAQATVMQFFVFPLPSRLHPLFPAMAHCR
jgi:hypothetical protein